MAKGGEAVNSIVWRCFSCNQRLPESFEDNESFGSEVYLNPGANGGRPRAEGGMEAEFTIGSIDDVPGQMKKQSYPCVLLVQWPSPAVATGDFTIWL